MEKQSYETPKIEVSELDVEDVITTSEFGTDANGLIGDLVSKDDTFWG